MWKLGLYGWNAGYGSLDCMDIQKIRKLGSYGWNEGYGSLDRMDGTEDMEV